MGRSLASIGWHLPLVRLITPPQPTVLIYHGVPRSGNGSLVDAAAFEQHILFIKKNFHCIEPQEMGASRHPTHRREVLLTFDDGMRNNFEVVSPILTRHRVPALFFISSRHAAPGRYLWFSYLRALEKYFPRDGFSFQGTYIDMRPPVREASIRGLRERLLNQKPHPAAMYRSIENELPPLEDFVPAQRLRDEYEGMRTEEICELAGNMLFAIGCHTVDHPFLCRCEPDEMQRQIVANKRWLESVTGRGCEAIAYPLGDYNVEVLDLCRPLFSQGYAVSASLRSTPHLEIPRVGIYSKSVEFVGFKVQWGNLLRAARVPFG